MKQTGLLLTLIIASALWLPNHSFAQVGVQDIKICVISDVHYFDTTLLINDGPALEEYLYFDPKLLRESYAITESLMDSLLNEHPDILLVPGDLTKDGELICHQKMANYFTQLEASGTRVFVCPGNHDINNPMAMAFDNDVTIPVPTIDPEGFKNIYNNFGYDEAIAVDTASLSYVAEPIQGLQILSMDVCRYDSNYIQNYPQTSGGFKPQVLQWVKDRIIDANSQGKVILGMMHHNLIEHFTNQKMIFGDYVLDNWQTVYPELADLGLKVVFTGHFHAQDMIQKTTAAGNTIYDIETASVVMYPCPYRIMTLQTNKILTVSGKRVEQIDYNTGSLTFQQYALQDIEAGVPPLIIYMLTSPPYSLGQATAEFVEPAFTESMIAHYAGNEGNPSSNTQSVMFWLTIFGYSYITQSLQSIWNDAAPDDWTTTINLAPTQNLITLHLTAMLEGPFNGSSMNSDLNPDFLNSNQPYLSAPWIYTGTEQVSMIPNSNIVDWVLVEIRDAAYAASAVSETKVGRCAAFLLNNGNIVGMDGSSNITFYHTIKQNLFVVIRHRNHLAEMSANPLVLSGGVYNYNFTTASSQVYGGTAATKQLSPGVWGMIAGDANSDGIINANDKTDFWSILAGKSGYLTGDYNLDGAVGNKDKNDFWNVNLNTSSQVPQ